MRGGGDARRWPGPARTGPAGRATTRPAGPGRPIPTRRSRAPAHTSSSRRPRPRPPASSGATSMVSQAAKKLHTYSTRLRRTGRQALRQCSAHHTPSASSSQDMAPVCPPDGVARHARGGQTGLVALLPGTTNARLSGLDASFLYLETPAMHMHVCLVAVLDPSTMPGGYSFKKIRRHIASRVPLVPPFHRVLHEVPLRLHHPRVGRGRALRHPPPRAPSAAARARHPRRARPAGRRRRQHARSTGRDRCGR